MSFHQFLVTMAACVGLVTIPASGPFTLAQETTADRPHPALLDPGLARETAPGIFRVELKTTAGDFVIQVHRDWAPHGADRFYNLVKIGYYEDAAFYRVINGFMAQFGMHADPAVTAAWMGSRIPSDPVAQSNTRGRVTFAMGGSPDTRTTQIFISFGDNSYLDEMGFAPIGEVVEGLENVDAIYAGYGEGQPRGRGPSQSELFRRGNAYLEGDFPRLDYIQEMRIID